MRRLLKAIFGTAGQIDDPPLTGITDVQYIAEALSSEGFTRSDIWESLPEISNRYLCEIEGAVSNGADFYVLPGVREGLEAISTNPFYCSAAHRQFRDDSSLNSILPACRSTSMSQAHLEISPFDRHELPKLAAQRVSGQLRMELQPSQFIIEISTQDERMAGKL